ncbi:MAG TPA: effector-associated domain EAD1-containing protein [Pyrinomonadaceae bacterium]|nr:effector-associated domain EAD1-containing protein [Pyrinomonadaceae bacterium]
MTLTGEQAAQLQRALTSAFPRPRDLEQMVRFRLNENLAEITEGGSLADLTFSLIKWAESVGRTEELVKGAINERPRNPDLQGFAAELRLVAPATPPATLGFPTRGKTGILIDLSHGQSEWDKDAIFNAANDRLVQVLQPPPKEAHWDLKEIRDRRQLNAEELKVWSGLLMGIPFHERIEDSTRDEIVKWVRGGGRLVMLGFELGERHHETNLNDLAGEFGLRFNSDIAGPTGWQSPWKPYDEPIDFMQVQSNHPAMKGVSRLRL